MPELPEVETIRKGLATYITGKKLKHIEVRYQKIFTGDPTQLYNKEIKALRRFGKGIVIDFADGVSLAVHVKMTGQFLYRNDKTQQGLHPTLPTYSELPNSWTHIIFTFADGSLLFYNDMRKFGWMRVVETKQVKELPFFRRLGPEPFADLTLNYFNKTVSRSGSPIKNLLMDQQKISGVGNIYANEALFLAKIQPHRPASTLSLLEAEVLYNAVHEVLRRGLAVGGATEANFVNVDGLPGGYQHQFLVYRKHGTRCTLCGNTIIRTVLGGRGTFWCSSCQH
jgi:formamidopyrimidine-DNA glycosylase